MSKRFANLSVKKLPHFEVEVAGEVSLEALKEARVEALKEINQRTTVPGFRPGHTPLEALVRSVGEMRVLEETAELVLGRGLGEILKEVDLSPIARPTVAITRLAPGIPLEFKIHLVVEPEFALPDYKNIAREVKVEDKEKRRLTIIENLVKATELDVPNLLVESELERMFLQFKDDIGKANYKWETYLKNIGKTEEGIKAEWRESALNRTKAELVLGKIAQAEKLEPTKEELEKEVAHLLSHHPDADPLRARIYVYGLLRNLKVLDFLDSLS